MEEVHALRIAQIGQPSGARRRGCQIEQIAGQNSVEEELENWDHEDVELQWLAKGRRDAIRGKAINDSGIMGAIYSMHVN